MSDELKPPSSNQALPEQAPRKLSSAEATQTLERLKAKQPENQTLSIEERDTLKSEVIEAIRQVYDPELPLNVYDLGLIYDVIVDELGDVAVTMTLTTPACPVAGTLPGEVERAVTAVHRIRSAKVELTWTPPWSKDRLSPEHQLLFSSFM